MSVGPELMVYRSEFGLMVPLAIIEIIETGGMC